MTDFGYLSSNVTINDKGRFSLPKDFHKPDEKENGFIIFCDTTNKKLRITTKKLFEIYRKKLEGTNSKSSLDPQIYAPDEQWRGTFSAAHRELLRNPGEVKFRGMDWFIEVSRIDSEIGSEDLIKADVDNADKMMSNEFYGEQN
jgi:hypothetical protein